MMKAGPGTEEENPYKKHANQGTYFLSRNRHSATMLLSCEAMVEESKFNLGPHCLLDGGTVQLHQAQSQFCVPPGCKRTLLHFVGKLGLLIIHGTFPEITWTSVSPVRFSILCQQTAWNCAQQQFDGKPE
jgi:hypothetical protein